MGRYAGPLLGVGLLLAAQLTVSAAAFLIWRHDVRRAR